MQPVKRPSGLTLLAALTLAVQPIAAFAAQPAAAWASSSPTYADLADLAESASLVLVAEPRKVARVDNTRAPGLRPGWGRFYVEARTVSLLVGKTSLGEDLAYLVDMPLDTNGNAVKIKKRQVVLFARPVRGKPGQLQLVSPGAQYFWGQGLESRLRPLLREVVSSDAPPEVTGVREIIHVPGTLAGEGETQIFLSTKSGAAASITVRHTPEQPPAWGVSFSELVAEVGNPPKRNTLAWYRLACFLPNTLPPSANLSNSPADQRQAAADYSLVLSELGSCDRARR